MRSSCRDLHVETVSHEGETADDGSHSQLEEQERRVDLARARRTRVSDEGSERGVAES